jgi:Tat protein secretion system quality control protein TatD with DNase activity
VQAEVQQALADRVNLGMRHIWHHVGSIRLDNDAIQWQCTILDHLAQLGTINIFAHESSNANVLYAAVGIHPHFVKDDWNDKAAEQLEEEIQKPGVCAVGEVGLDFNREYTPKDLQKTAFKKQVELAVKYKKALLVHDRDAHDAVMEILSSYSNLPTVVIHCFTGDATQVKAYLAKG